MAAHAGRGALKRLGIIAAGIVGVAVGVLAGRWTPPSPALFAARSRWAADAAQVDASLTALEDRLLTTQARVHLWEELRTRHGEVAQVACTNLGEHASAMVAAYQRSNEQPRARKHSRLAAATTAERSGSGDM